MKKYLRFFVALSFVATSCTTVQVAPNQDPEMEQQIEKILSQMTLEEKIGQMTQLTLDVLTKGGATSTKFPMELDPALMDTVLGKYKVGSIFNVPSGVPMTREKWSETIKAIQDRATAETGIPLIYAIDQIHGSTYTIGGTLFPQEVNLGATFNPSLVEQSTAATAYEAKSASMMWNFAPVLDLGREPRWPRHWETYSEDSYLVAEMGKAAIRGYQGDEVNPIAKNKIAACLKHYMGYGVPFSGKDRTPSYINDQDMRERHFAPFLAAVRQGALTVMVNSATNNGTPLHINAEYLTQWLKEDLNWDGVIVTDWGDINNVYSRDKIASSKKEAIKMAINAGIDMSMVPYEWSFAIYLKELVEEGEVKMSRIDDAVRRVLRLKFRMNLFEEPYYDLEDFSDFGSQKHADISRAGADESITLLKNVDDILPLAKGKKVLLTGPNANSMRTINGGWSLSWQGETADRYCSEYNTILEAMQNMIGKENVVYVPGVTYNFEGNWQAENTPDIQSAVRAASGVDYIVACVGENSYCETPGNLDDLTISRNQTELVKALAKTGKPIILVLNEGRPRIINEMEPVVEAVVQTYLPSHFGADALCAILWGEVNPSGRLPYTYPRYVDGLSTYDHKHSEQRDVMEGVYNYDAVISTQWAFGYGLSYTTFEYSNLEVDKKEFTAADTLTFKVTVTNSGDMAGKHTIMLFSSDLIASLTPDVRRLRAFDKIELQPSGSEVVTLKVPASSLAFVGADNKWILEKGEFQIQVGDQVVTINCKETKRWETPNI